MEPPEIPVSVPTPGNPQPLEGYIYVANLEVWEADQDSFCVGGRRFYWRDHGLVPGDRVRVTIERLTPDNRNLYPPGD